MTDTRKPVECVCNMQMDVPCPADGAVWSWELSAWVLPKDKESGND